MYKCTECVMFLVGVTNQSESMQSAINISTTFCLHCTADANYGIIASQ